MAVNTDALTTKASAKLALGIPTAVTTDDDYIDALINAASEYIEDQCNRQFVRRDYNDGAGTHSTTGVSDESRYRFSGDGRSRTHVLPQYPVDEDSTFLLEMLDERGSSVSGDETWESTTYVLWDSYVVDWEKGIITILTDNFSNAFFAKGVRNFRVTYTAGYQKQNAAPWVPEDLQRACNEVVKQLFKGGQNITSEKIGTWSRTYAAESKNAYVEMILEKYKSISSLVV